MFTVILLQKNPILEEHKASIDLGCVYAKITKEDKGKLCALEFPTLKIFTQEYED